MRTDGGRRPARSLDLTRVPEPLESRLVMAVFTVNSAVDLLRPPAGVVTLRSAIEAANASPGPDTIDIPGAGTYKVTSVGHAGDNSAGEFDILGQGGDLTIQNTGGGVVTIDGGGTNSVFVINSGNTTSGPFTVTLRGLTITGGVSNTGGGVVAIGSGTGNVVLDHSVVTGNTAGSGGGGVDMISGNGSLTVLGGAIVNNTTFGQGGGISATGTGAVVIGLGAVIADNTARFNGGGVYLEGAPLTVSGAVIRHDVADGDGGGIYDSGPDGLAAITLVGAVFEQDGAGDDGGGVEVGVGSGPMTVSHSVFVNNTAGGSGGGVDAAAFDASYSVVTLQGNSAGSNGGGLSLTGHGLIHLTDSELVDNSAGGTGGGIEDEGESQLDLAGCTVADNRSLSNGGGITNPQNFGLVSIVDSLFRGNAAIFNGGALSIAGGTLQASDSEFTGNAAGMAAVAQLTGTSFSITACTLDSNRASASIGALEIILQTPGVPPFTLPLGELVNDTIVGNVSGGSDAALTVIGTGQFLALIDDTIDGNAAALGAGGVDQDGNVSVQGTIIAGNTVGGAPADYFDSSGTLTDGGGNLLGSTTGTGGKFSAGTLVGDPKLGPLLDHGGPRAGAPSDSRVVPTQALLPGSPAFGKGVFEFNFLHDERGFDRPLTPSIGAYEPQYASNDTPDQVLVEDLYETLLDHIADPAGMSNSLAFLRGGGSPKVLVRAIETSLDSLQRQATLLFHRYLDRDPTSAEQSGIVAYLRSGHSPEQAAAVLLKTGEFAADYGFDQDAIIAGTYQTVLDRAPQPDEIAAWDQVLNTGLSRSTMADLFVASPIFLADGIADEFQAYLGRPPQPSEADAFLKASQAGFSDEFLASLILGSGESVLIRSGA